MKNIVENEDGDIQLKIENGRSINELIDEIEQTNPEDADAKPITLSIKDSIGVALVKHPDILAAKLDTDINRSYVIQAWSAYFPYINGSLVSHVIIQNIMV